MSAVQTEKVDADRAAAREAFLAASAFRNASVVQLGSDASIRQYFRLTGGPSPALLMDAPSAAVEPPCPPAAAETERRRLGYGAMVRGSGSSLVAYGAASRVLASLGLKTPQVIEMDAEAGFALVEDLGAEHILDAAAGPASERALYAQAADILDRIRTRPAKPVTKDGWVFQDYDRLAYETEVALLTEWYLPYAFGRTLTEEEERRLLSAWREAFAALSAPLHFVHRDFHAENLLVTPDGIGVLDFQDLMIGQAAYDWASLIEDARRDVSEEVRRETYARGVAGADDPQAFETDYAILAAQRNAKILGLFARLITRDGKPRYKTMIPRVEAFFRQDLQRPALSPVRGVLADLAPELVRG